MLSDVKGKVRFSKDSLHNPGMYCPPVLLSVLNYVISPAFHESCVQRDRNQKRKRKKKHYCRMVRVLNLIICFIYMAMNIFYEVCFKS